MSIVDIIIVLFVLVWGAVGFQRGFIKETTMFVGLVAVIAIAFMLKNPVAAFLYERLPFFNFFGIFKGVTVLNILLYELIAFFLVLVVLMFILRIFTFFSNIIEKILNFTIIFGIPSKLMGFVVGLIEGYLLVFLILFFMSLPTFNFKIINDSSLKPKILTQTPILSKMLDNTIASFEDIYTLKVKYNKSTSNDQFNQEALGILLKHKIVSVESIEKLVDSGKLKVKGIDDILEEYK